MKIPLLKPNMPSIDEWAKYFNLSYEKSYFANNGPCCNLLEKRFQNYMSQMHLPVLTSSATMGLVVALKAFDLQDCDILIPSFTFSATALSVLEVGCNPIFVDIDRENWFLDIRDAERKVTKKTRAMIVVHTLGATPEYQCYEAFAKKYNIFLIFDSASTFGAEYPDGQKVGVAGDCEIFSFHATKTFGIGEGGLIVSSNNEFLEKCRKLINFGFEEDEVVLPGLNGKLPEVSAAIGLAVLDNFESKLQKRRRVADLYNKKIKSKKLDLIIQKGESKTKTFQVFTIFFNDVENKQKAIRKLEKVGIGFREYYFPLHKHSLFKKNENGEFPNTEYVSERCLCIPMWEDLKEKEVNKIIKVLESAQKENK